MNPERICRGNYIQGHFLKVDDPNGEVESRNPGNLELSPITFPFCFAHVHEAVSAAKRGFSSWKRLPAATRNAALMRYRDLLQQRAETLAWHIAFEVGKPLWEARLEVSKTLTLIDWAVKEGSQTAVQLTVDKADEEASTGVVRFHARGVMAVIPPASQPLFGSHLHAMPALVHGNTVVMKASKAAPMVGQFIAECVHDAGLPAGVLNLIHGDSEVARRLTSDSDVDGIFFTGHYETGFKIRKQVLSDYWKTIVLELGGKNTLVVWDDCQYEKTLHEAVYSSFLTTGQRCLSTSRILVHEKLFDKFVENFHTLSKKCRIGSGLTEGADTPFMGPLLSEGAMENYLRYQGIAVREGCDEIMRGKPLERGEKGYYVSPSIHVVATPDSKSVYQKNEIFGPNVALYKVRDLDEAAELVNLPQHGLAASIYTGARENYLRLAEEVKVGMFHWNRPTVTPCFRLPYGGLKKSGNARPMGSFSGYQCTYPVSSLEYTGGFEISRLPVQLPKLDPKG